MDLPKQLGDLECSMFEPPAKRSRPSPFQISQAVPKRFLKAYTHVPEKAMGTVSFFGWIFPALVALLTSELCFHKFKATLVLRVEMTKTTADGKSKVERPYFSSKPYTILSQHDIENAIAKAQSAIETNIDKWTREGSDNTLYRQNALPTTRSPTDSTLSRTRQQHSLPNSPTASAP